VAADRLEPTGFEVRRSGAALAGEEVGEGPAVVLLHGLTATRRYVVHGSVALPRRGYRMVSYDARGARRVGAGARRTLRLPIPCGRPEGRPRGAL